MEGQWPGPQSTPSAEHLIRAPPGRGRERTFGGRWTWVAEFQNELHENTGFLPQGGSQGAVAVSKPNPSLWEETRSHSCKQAALWSLLLRNEKKTSPWLYFLVETEGCAHKPLRTCPAFDRLQLLPAGRFLDRLLFSPDSTLISSQTGLRTAHRQFLFSLQEHHKRKRAEKRENCNPDGRAAWDSALSPRSVLRQKAGGQLWRWVSGWGWGRDRGGN